MSRAVDGSRAGIHENETFDTFRVRLRSRYEALSPHLQRLARLALEDPNAFALETVAGIATRAGVQPSTVIRFSKEFGFEGFSSLQKVFRLRLIEGEPGLRQEAYRERQRLERTASADPASVLAEFHSIRHRVELCSGTPIEKGPDGPAWPACPSCPACSACKCS